MLKLVIEIYGIKTSFGGGGIIVLAVIKTVSFPCCIVCLKVSRHFGGICHHLQGWRTSKALLATSFMLVSCLAYFSALNMEVTCFSKTSVDFQQNTLYYIPEDRTLPTQNRFILHNTITGTGQLPPLQMQLKGHYVTPLMRLTKSN
jgi:hypothetical protein